MVGPLLDRGGDPSFNKGRGRKTYLFLLRRIQQFFRRLGAQDSAPHIHQDKDPIIGINGRYRFLNF